jgi:hypothetical protein
MQQEKKMPRRKPKWRGGEEATPARLADARPRLQQKQWPEIAEGDRVEVIAGGQTLSGTVECVTDDGLIFWMWQDDGGGRIAILESDNSEVRRKEAGPPAAI